MIQQLKVGIRSALNVAGVNAHVSDRIYSLQAPAGVTYPFIVFYESGGAFDTSHAGENVNSLVSIAVTHSKAASSSAQTVAGQTYDAILAAMTQTAVSMTGYNVYWCAPVSSPLERAWTTEGIQYFQVIGTFRIRAEKL